jgi:phosphomannomutase
MADSGEMVRDLVVSTLTGLGLDVHDLGLSTTPTVEMAVLGERAAGGIIITASHNAKEWNALKLLNSSGEFISADDGLRILEKAAKDAFVFASVDKLGVYTVDNSYMHKHIQAILDYPLIDLPAIRAKHFKVVVDSINSTGALFIPPLLKALGIENIRVLNEEINGKFAHNPEPLPENLSALSAEVKNPERIWVLLWIRMWTDFVLFVKTERCLAKNSPWWLLPTMSSHKNQVIQSAI